WTFWPDIGHSWRECLLSANAILGSIESAAQNSQQDLCVIALPPATASPHDGTPTKLRSNTSRVLGRAINRFQKFNIVGGWCAGAGLSLKKPQISSSRPIITSDGSRLRCTGGSRVWALPGAAAPPRTC